MKLPKKIILGTLLIILLAGTVAAFNGHYDIICPACNEQYHKDKRAAGCNGCHAWRMYGLEAKDYAKGYMVYHCQHGHELLVPKNDSEDKSEIKVRDKNGKWRNIDSTYVK